MPFTQHEMVSLTRAVGAKVNDTKRCLKRAVAKANIPLVNNLQKQLIHWENLYQRVQDESPPLVPTMAQDRSFGE